MTALREVTAETLTDEMIREFYLSLDPDVEGEGALMLICSTALMPDKAMSVAAFPMAKSAARRRIAAAINARAKAGR